MSNRFDVVIIGGGIAGLSCAIECSLNGHKVLLCEKKIFPVDKPCGEGIMPHGVSSLRNLGVLSLIAKADQSPFFGVTFIDGQGLSAQANFWPHKRGLGIRRLALSQAFYERAKQISGITIMSPVSVLGLEQKNGLMAIKTTAGQFLTPIVVGADGLFSKVRKWAGIEKVNNFSKRYGLRQHFLLREKLEQVEVHFAGGIEAYLTPSGEATNVAFLWHKSFLDQNEGISFQSLLEFFPKLSARLHGAKPLSAARAIGPLAQRPLSITADGIALVGDASGYLDAITGEGNSLAMAEARALSLVIKKALMKNPHELIKKAQLREYVEAHRKITKAYYRNTKMLLFLAQKPKILSRFIKASKLLPRLFSSVINRACG